MNFFQAMCHCVEGTKVRRKFWKFPFTWIMYVGPGLDTIYFPNGEEYSPGKEDIYAEDWECVHD